MFLEQIPNLTLSRVGLKDAGITLSNYLSQMIIRTPKFFSPNHFQASSEAAKFGKLERAH